MVTNIEAIIVLILFITSKFGIECCCSKVCLKNWFIGKTKSKLY